MALYRSGVLAGPRCNPLQRQNLSRLGGEQRLPPCCDWSACLHQHFLCTWIFNPTRPFFYAKATGW